MVVPQSPELGGAVRGLQRLIEQVYEASLSPDSLAQSISHIAHALRGDLGVLLVRDRETQNVAMAVVADSRDGGNGRDCSSAHAELFRAPTTRFDGAFGAWVDALWPTNALTRRIDGVALPALNVSPSPSSSSSEPVEGGSHRAMVAPVGDQGALAIFRRLPEPQFDDTECADLHLVAGHLQQAVTLLARMAEQDRRTALVAGAMDLVAAPLVVVDGQARMLWANARGLQALDLRDGVVLIDGRIEAQGLRSNVRLQALIAEVSLAAENGRMQPQALALSRGTDRRPLAVVVRACPARASASLLGGLVVPAGGVILDLSALDMPLAPSAELLQDVFGLSPAEAALLLALMQDKRIEDHAQARGVSVTTVRTQLAHLFRKTGTNRQSELVGLVTRVTSGVSWLASDPLDGGEAPE